MLFAISVWTSKYSETSPNQVNAICYFCLTKYSETSPNWWMWFAISGWQNTVKPHLTGQCNLLFLLDKIQWNLTKLVNVVCYFCLTKYSKTSPNQLNDLLLMDLLYLTDKIQKTSPNWFGNFRRQYILRDTNDIYDEIIYVAVTFLEFLLMVNSKFLEGVVFCFFLFFSYFFFFLTEVSCGTKKVEKHCYSIYRI